MEINAMLTKFSLENMRVTIPDQDIARALKKFFAFKGATTSVARRWLNSLLQEVSEGNDPFQSLDFAIRAINLKNEYYGHSEWTEVKVIDLIRLLSMVVEHRARLGIEVAGVDYEKLAKMAKDIDSHLWADDSPSQFERLRLKMREIGIKHSSMLVTMDPNGHTSKPYSSVSEGIYPIHTKVFPKEN